MGQILAKYFFKLYCQKIFAVSFKSYVQLVPLFYSHPFHSLLELQLILVKILLLLRWVSTRTQISNKSETDFKYFCLKYMNRQKMEAKVCFS